MKIHYMTQESGIPPRFIHKTLDTFKAETEAQKRALHFAKCYTDDIENTIKTGRSAVFVGGVGTGKTHLATGIALAAIGHLYTVRFTTVQRMIRDIKDSWKDTRTESEVMEYYTRPRLLILDEVGVQFGTDFERNVLFDIINERYEYNRPQILVTNLQKNELTEFLGDRVIDRLREGGGKVIAFDWESKRGQL
jgi:DNA replication protein DnaC